MATRRVFTTKAGTELPLLDLKGKEYLQVADRLVWFREEKPLWTIETSFVRLDEKVSIARAEIRDEQGRIIATGHKTETPGGFADFVEKSETGAVGRALAMVGYGTQFCADDLSEGERIVDAPRPVLARKSEAPLDPGSVVITFGKYTGKRIDQMGDTLEGWVSFMRQNKNLSGKALEAVQAAEAFLGGKNV